MNDTDPGPEASFDDIGETAEAPDTEAPLAPKADDEYLRAKARGLRAGLDRQAARKTGSQMGTLPPPPLPTPPETVDEPALLGKRDWFPMPETFDSFVGQDQVRLLLRSLAYVEDQTKQPTPPTLLCALPGCGKRTLAHLYAREINKPIVVHSPSTIIIKRQLADLISENRLYGKVLLFEDIDQFPEEMASILITASAGGLYSIKIDLDDEDSRVAGRPLPFTLICTCDDPIWDSDGPLRSRFAYQPSFTTRYTLDEAVAILTGFCARNDLQLDAKAGLNIAQAAGQELPHLTALLRWVIAYALGSNKSFIDEAMSKEALNYY